MNEANLVKKLENELEIIQEECRARGRGIRAFQRKSITSLETAATELEHINPSHPDVQLFDELILALDGQSAYNPQLYQEIKTAQSEDTRMVKQLKKHIANFKKTDKAREKAIRAIIDLMREYQLRVN